MNAIFRDINGTQIPTPPARSFAAIRREAQAAARRYDSPRGRDGMALRAVQYALAVHGVETRYREWPFDAGKFCEFGRAPDGSTRVRFVHLSTEADGTVFPWPIRRDGGTRYEIPHWDFVPSVVEVEPQGAFA